MTKKKASPSAASPGLSSCAPCCLTHLWHGCMTANWPTDLSIWWLLGLDKIKHVRTAGSEFTAGRVCSNWKGSQVGSRSCLDNSLIPEILLKGCQIGSRSCLANDLIPKNTCEVGIVVAAPICLGKFFRTLRKMVHMSDSLMGNLFMHFLPASLCHFLY